MTGGHSGETQSSESLCGEEMGTDSSLNFRKKKKEPWILEPEGNLRDF